MSAVDADVALERSLRDGVGDAPTESGGCVPVIDMGAADAGERMWEAARSVGFFTLVNHGVDAAAIERGFAASERFFGEAVAVKRRESPFEASQNAGYEFFSQVRPSTGLADQKESLQITARAGAMDGRWPRTPPSFERDARDLLAQAHGLGRRVLSLLELSTSLRRSAHRSVLP